MIPIKPRLKLLSEIEGCIKLINKLNVRQKWHQSGSKYSGEMKSKGNFKTILTSLKYITLGSFTIGPVFYYQTLSSYEKRQVDVTISGFGRFLRFGYDISDISIFIQNSKS